MPAPDSPGPNGLRPQLRHALNREGAPFPEGAQSWMEAHTDWVARQVVHPPDPQRSYRRLANYTERQNCPELRAEVVGSITRLVSPEAEQVERLLQSSVLNGDLDDPAGLQAAVEACRLSEQLHTRLERLESLAGEVRDLPLGGTPVAELLDSIAETIRKARQRIHQAESDDQN